MAQSPTQAMQLSKAIDALGSRLGLGGQQVGV